MAQKILNCSDLTALIGAIKVIIPVRSSGGAGLYIGQINGSGDDKLSIFIKVAPYLVDPHMSPEKSADALFVTDTEINVMRALKTLIIDRKNPSGSVVPHGTTPHISEILGVIHCDSIDRALKNFEDECDKIVHGKTKRTAIDMAKSPQDLLCWIRERIRAGRALDKFAIIISEVCNITFDSMISGHISPVPAQGHREISIILFQIYFTLVVIQRFCPGFVHGDLHARNIMVNFEAFGPWDPLIPRAIRYKMDDHIWDVPYLGYIAKLIDFGHSHMPSEGIHSSAQYNTITARGDQVPDHIVLAIDLGRVITRLPSGKYNPLANIMPHINPQGANDTMSLRVIINEIVPQSPKIEDILCGPLFKQFARRVDDDMIIRSYCAPNVVICVIAQTDQSAVSTYLRELCRSTERIIAFASASDSPPITSDARKLLSSVRSFIVVTGNTSAESARCVAGLQREFPASMCAGITLNTIIRDILSREGWKKLYCIADPEDHAIIRETIGSSIRVKYADDPIEAVDCVYLASWRWPLRHEMEHLCATLFMSSAREADRAQKVPVMSVTADGYEYTAFIDTNDGSDGSSRSQK